MALVPTDPGLIPGAGEKRELAPLPTSKHVRLLEWVSSLKVGKGVGFLDMLGSLFISAFILQTYLISHKEVLLIN